MPPNEQRLCGVCAAVLTPLDEALQPEPRALVAHCRRLLELGCDAINLLGTTGEATSFSVSTRIAVMEAVAASDLPLSRFMVGTGAAAFDDALALTHAALRLGFAGALVIPPFYFKAIVDDGAFSYYARLIETIADDRLRLYLYNFPQLSGFAFSAQLVTRLATAFPKTVIGMKDSSGTPGYAESIVAAAPQLDVFPSSETVLADAKDKGFAGCISATINVDAPLAARVWRGERERVAELGAIRTTIARHQLVPALRAVMGSLYADERWLRVVPPLVRLAAADAAALVADLDAQPAFATLRAAYACA